MATAAVARVLYVVIPGGSSGYTEVTFSLDSDVASKIWAHISAFPLVGEVLYIAPAVSVKYVWPTRTKKPWGASLLVIIRSYKVHEGSSFQSVRYVACGAFLAT